jgi:hypothetical protein
MTAPPDSFTEEYLIKNYGPIGPERMVFRGGLALLCREFRKGYIFKVGDDPFMFIGAGIDTELYSKPGLGQFNITKALRMIASYPKQYPTMQIPVTQQMLDLLDDHQTEQHVIDNMTLKRRDEPIIYLEIDGGHHLIDGAHRLKRRIRDGLDHMLIKVMNREEAELVRVRMYEFKENRWQRYDVMPAMFAGHV